MSVSGWRYTHVSTASTEAKKGHCVLGGRGTGGCEPPMWMLRSELRTSAGADSALEDRPILQQPLCTKHSCIGLMTGTVISLPKQDDEQLWDIPEVNLWLAHSLNVHMLLNMYVLLPKRRNLPGIPPRPRANCRGGEPGMGERQHWAPGPLPSASSCSPALVCPGKVCH